MHTAAADDYVRNTQPGVQIDNWALEIRFGSIEV